MELLERQGGARRLLRSEVPSGTVGLAWLGQAGFALKSQRALVLIDPYLSDHLGAKYRGTKLPHERMMAAPIGANELGRVDAVLCTHRHGDHMDPGTLPVVARENPRCRFVVPRAEQEHAITLGLPDGRLYGVDAEETICPADGVEVLALPAAHESIETNDRGENRFLGFVVRMGGLCVYHSGDCVPYEGLAQRLRREAVDLALLPVNGRDAYRRENGILGNMDFEEAVAICQAAGIGWLVPHHFGMFALNTVTPQSLAERAGRAPRGLRIVVPRIEATYWSSGT
jgi:L-ascorbate metabolism protein UlaG (beta-lactamase superfamily)